MQTLQHTFVALFVSLLCSACNQYSIGPDTRLPDTDSTRLPIDTTYKSIPLQSSITHTQPMTGLVLWPYLAKTLNSTYGDAFTLEFSYCLPCQVVTGKTGNRIDYDWTSFEQLLDDIASRKHQAIIRFRYEYPSSTDVNGTKGATAVPDYIKALPDYNETYSKNPGGDGPTYYADWSNSELQWFTKQFYTDFNQRYANDPRIAFLEIGFGHWSEYHIYGTKLQLGTNFPSKAYQSEFLTHIGNTMNIPWLISIDAADEGYTPIVASSALMQLPFGLFDDSFMHKEHDKTQGEGYNEDCWNAIGKQTRWQQAPCGGEISYYTSKDQHDFLNPQGLYGITWEQASAKYHITFMIANDAPDGKYGTAERCKTAGIACGYKFKVLDCRTKTEETQLLVKNIGIAPIYRDAYFAIGSARSKESLKALLPGERLMVTIPQQLEQPNDLRIVSDYLPEGQTIEYESDLH
ncbi:MAG: DUF4832 domain-containing protein [Paludibacter sp.]|nr:DUF4832 domain-containing protein [Bacteroidales bacterium]MCM1069553.1 DUF4832 domain-containing protein [Prevotella sp.]MCM1354199.1 DUF4832 domain-containing protein [Bacteroides sp.]MCM1443062.1 DUF4832 domain-containing protein [Muribaculum sp.]MCM1482273.1 DUF4832 domain-containing protein [Paludibacter sp.]